MFLLWLLGWKEISPECLDLFRKTKRSIIVFSHTSYIDFLVLMVYWILYPEMKKIRFLIAPDYHNVFTRWLGGIASTSIRERNGGAVGRIVSELEKEEEFCFLISPKGSRYPGPWRTGYRVMADKLHIPIMLGGFDYETKKIHLTVPQTMEQLLDDLSQIVPLHPEREVVSIRNYKSCNVIEVDSPMAVITYSLVIIAVFWFLW